MVSCGISITWVILLCCWYWWSYLNEQFSQLQLWWIIIMMVRFYFSALSSGSALWLKNVFCNTTLEVLVLVISCSLFIENSSNSRIVLNEFRIMPLVLSYWKSNQKVYYGPRLYTTIICYNFFESNFTRNLSQDDWGGLTSAYQFSTLICSGLISKQTTAHHSLKEYYNCSTTNFKFMWAHLAISFT